jgi:hypothetical protein
MNLVYLQSNLAPTDYFLNSLRLCVSVADSEIRNSNFEIQ